MAFQSCLHDTPISPLDGDAHPLSDVCGVGELVPLFYRKLMIAYENVVMGILYFLEYTANFRYAITQNAYFARPSSYPSP